MSRFRLPFVIAGVVGALVVAALVFVVIRVGRGTPVDLPVAIDDVPPGTEIDPARFRLQQVRGLDAATLEAYVEAGEFAAIVGHRTLETIHAGSPVLWAQVDPARQPRLTLALSDPAHLIYPLPVAADQVGDYLVAGDVIDVIFTLGRAGQQELVHGERWETAAVGSGRVTTDTLRPTFPRYGATQVHTTTLLLPVSKVILADVPVLRVEREVVRPAGAGYSLGTGSEDAAVPAAVEGEIVRLYLELDREQAEVLSFALHNGALNLPARAQPAGGASEGFTWNDFADLFFEGRPEAELRGEE